MMTCWYCKHILLVDTGQPNGKTGEVATLTEVVPCRSCGAEYYLEIQLSRSPKLSAEAIDLIMNKPRG